jgi:hypothetical protein
MRIALDARKLTSSTSGIGSYTLNLARALLEEDKDLELLLLCNRTPGQRLWQSPRVKEVIFPFPALSPFQFAFRPFLPQASMSSAIRGGAVRSIAAYRDDSRILPRQSRATIPFRARLLFGPVSPWRCMCAASLPDTRSSSMLPAPGRLGGLQWDRPAAVLSVREGGGTVCSPLVALGTSFVLTAGQAHHALITMRARPGRLSPSPVSHDPRTPRLRQIKPSGVAQPQGQPGHTALCHR